jgi:calmodulin
MYHRCRNDITGTEPRRLFNVAEFVMNDKHETGTVSMENAMQIMYLRFGRNNLDAQLEDIFGTSDLNSGKTLTLTEFLSSLHASQVKQLRSRVTAKTYVAPLPGKTAKAE